MGDPESHEPAVDESVPCYADQMEQNGGLVRGDADNDNLQLNAGWSDTVPFFPSFFDNLGPRYQAPDSECPRDEMTPPGVGHVLQDSASLKTDFDIREKKSPHSSRRAAQDAMLAHYVSDSVSSICGALSRTSSGCEGGVSEGRGCRICAVAVSKHEYWLQCQCSPVSSAGSSASCLQTPNMQQCKKRTSRALPEEREDHWSHGCISTRLWSAEDFQQDLPQIAPAVLPSWRRDLDEIIHYKQVARSTSAERRRRLRVFMSPARPKLSWVTAVMDQTLITMQQWHFGLGLDNSACPIIASHIFQRASRKLCHCLAETHEQFRLRVLMATAFWVAAKVVETKRKIPIASVMANTASITAKSLIHSELPLLDALRWNLVQY